MDPWTRINRRAALKGAVAVPLLATGMLSARASANDVPGSRGVGPRNPQPVDLSGPALLEAFVKLKARTDGKVSIGWMDAVTYAFIEGETFPLYRLFAATWYRFTRASPDRFEGAALEVATYHDIESGEELQSLRMPRTGQLVDVPRFRSGPSQLEVVLHQRDEKKFSMPQATGKQGSSFFQEGIARRRGDIGTPERDGWLLSIKDSHETRVIPANPAAPGFFYSEWTIYRGAWDAVMNPAVALVPAEVVYSSLASFRPWMKMGNTPGHTVQSGIGAKVERVEELPTRILDLCRKYHPDLVNAPDKVFSVPAP